MGEEFFDAGYDFGHTSFIKYKSITIVTRMKKNANLWP